MSEHVVTEGTVIHGSLRAEDLLIAFMRMLESIDEEKANRVKDDYEIETRHELLLMKPELQSEALERLFDELDAIAAASDMRFGAHENDGADFGFWKLQ
jgi:hypothetical protein